jgi:hypothetical protein
MGSRQIVLVSTAGISVLNGGKLKQKGFFHSVEHFHIRLNLIHTRLDLIHTRLDLIHIWFDLIHIRLDLIQTWLDLIHFPYITCTAKSHACWQISSTRCTCWRKGWRSCQVLPTSGTSSALQSMCCCTVKKRLAICPSPSRDVTTGCRPSPPSLFSTRGKAGRNHLN